MLKSTLIILSLFAFTFVNAQEWEEITSNEESTTFMRAHSENSAWFKEVPFDVPTDYNKYGMDKTRKGYMVSLYKFDCGNKQLGLLMGVFYDNEGNVLHSMEVKEVFLDMHYAIPESMGEFLVNKFCEIKKKNNPKKKRLDDLNGGIGESDGPTTGGEGNHNQAGDKGQLDSDTYAPSYYGRPGNGSGGVGYGLRGRGRPTKSKVFPDCDEEGRVIVKINVDRSGNVTLAKPGERGTTGDVCLYDAAKKTALTYKWPADSKAPEKQEGFVVINFSVTN